MQRDTADIADKAARFKKLYTAAVYDILDEMGLPNQCIDLGIRALDRSMRIAGPAFTVKVSADVRTDEEYDIEEVKTFTFFRKMYPGCVVLIAAAGERHSGHWGELMSTGSKSRGATGIVVDGGIRDGNILINMEDLAGLYPLPLADRVAQAHPHQRHRSADRGDRHADGADPCRSRRLAVWRHGRRGRHSGRQGRCRAPACRRDDHYRKPLPQ